MLKKIIQWAGTTMCLWFATPLNAQINCDVGSSGLVPLLDLQTGTYLGYQAGLYPGGTNILSGTHLKNGKSIAKGIKPLDGDGNINFGDGVVLVAGFGPSVPGHIFNKFVEHVRTPSETYNLNPCLDAINLCVGGKDISYPTVDSLAADYWEGVVAKVYDVGYTPAQVQIGWMYFNAKGLTEPPVFPDNALEMTESYVLFVNKAKEYFPNLKIMYMSSRHWGGYADTTLTEYYSLAEPASYQNSWSVKWAVEAQINQTDTRLKYKGGVPPAPFLLWGPNYWCDANNPRAWDGKKYICSLSYNPDDGYHLTDQQDTKDALDILNVIYYGVIGKQFAQNGVVWEDCVPYLDTLAALLGYREELMDIQALKVSPNPGDGEFYISLPSEEYAAEVTVINSMGQIVDAFVHEENFSTEVLVDISNQPDGMYFVKVMMNDVIHTVRLLKQQ